MFKKKEDVYNIIPKIILENIIENFALDIDQEHGYFHWVRVINNGLTIAKETGANPKIILVFGFFHDVERENEFDDFEHGLRGGELMLSYRDQINLTDEEIQKAYQACKGHTDQLHNIDIDIGTCYDADRLDLYRVGKTPSEDYLNNEYSKEQKTIDDAIRRTMSNEIGNVFFEIYEDLILKVKK